MALCVFFGLKNTPLGSIASVSHSQLNVLHRMVGYTTVFLLAIHALVYTIHFGRQGRLVQLLKKEDLEGMGAGVAMLVLLAGVFRHKNYEVFYVSHILGFMAAVLLTALHRPNWAKKIPTVMLIIFSVWVFDRLIRLSRLLCNLINNSATFYPLPDGGTRLILKKPGMEAALPGSHCFLWIPRLRFYENHPFTIVSNDFSGLEIVMKSQEGFTKAVESFASKNHRNTLWASVDGPYGSLPDMDNYDRLVFIAGGSGAAFTFGVMNRIMMQHEKAAFQSIEFVWAVRHIGKFELGINYAESPPLIADILLEQLNWFRRHLCNIAKSGLPISLKVYVTDERPGCGSVLTVLDPAESQPGRDHAESEALLRADAYNYETISEMSDISGLFHETTFNEQTFSIMFEKLDIDTTISESMRAAERDQWVLIGSCGPKSLMEAVEDAASNWQNKRGIRIDVHCEDFDNC